MNRWIHVVWLLAAWVVLQWMSALLAGGEGVMLATPAHIGGFIAGLAMHKPLAALALPESLGLFRVARPRNAVRIRLEQPVQVDHHIFHLGIVDGALRRAAPGVFRGGIAVVQADQVDVVEVRRNPGRCGSFTRPPKTR